MNWGKATFLIAALVLANPLFALYLALRKPRGSNISILRVVISQPTYRDASATLQKILQKEADFWVWRWLWP